jgi:hypothetical protein
MKNRVGDENVGYFGSCKRVFETSREKRFASLNICLDITQ